MKNKSEILQYFFIDPCNTENGFFDKYYNHNCEFELFSSLKRAAQTLQLHYFKLLNNSKIEKKDFDDIKKITEEIRTLCTKFTIQTDERFLENNAAFLIFKDIQEQIKAFNLKIESICNLNSSENTDIFFPDFYINDPDYDLSQYNKASIYPFDRIEQSNNNQSFISTAAETEKSITNNESLSLDELPFELKLHIGNFLKLNELPALAATSKLFKEVADEVKNLKIKEFEELFKILIELTDFELKNSLTFIFTAIIADKKNTVIKLSKEFPKLFFQPLFVNNQLITPLSLIKNLNHQDWLDEIATFYLPADASDIKEWNPQIYPSALDWMIACHTKMAINYFFNLPNIDHFFLTARDNKSSDIQFTCAEQAVIHKNNHAAKKIFEFAAHCEDSYFAWELQGYVFSPLIHAVLADNIKFIEKYHSDYSMFINNNPNAQDSAYLHAKDLIELESYTILPERYSSRRRNIPNFLSRQENFDLNTILRFSFIHFLAFFGKTKTLLNHLNNNQDFYFKNKDCAFYFPPSLKQFLLFISGRKISGIEQIEKMGWTPLMVAALAGHHELVSEIFKRSLFNINTEIDRNCGFNVLHCSILSGCSKTLAVVMQDLKAHNLLEQASNITLENVCQTNATDLADYLIKHTSNNDLKNTAQLYFQFTSHYPKNSLLGLAPELQQYTLEFLNFNELSPIAQSSKIYREAVINNRISRIQKLLSTLKNSNFLEMVDAILKNDKETVIQFSKTHPALFFQFIFIENQFITPIILIKMLGHQDWLQEVISSQETNIENLPKKHEKVRVYPNLLDWAIACDAEELIENILNLENIDYFIEVATNSRSLHQNVRGIKFSYVEQAIIYKTKNFLKKILELKEKIGEEEPHRIYLNTNLTGIAFSPLILAALVNNKKFITEYHTTFSQRIKDGFTTGKDIHEEILSEPISVIPWSMLTKTHFAKISHDFNPIISPRFTYLHFLALLGNELCLNYLSSENPFYLSEENEFSFFSFPEIFQNFLQYMGHSSTGVLPNQDQIGWTPLMAAAIAGHTHIVSQIFQKEFFNKKTETSRNKGFNVLCCAILSGNTETLKAVIKGLKSCDLLHQSCIIYNDGVQLTAEEFANYLIEKSDNEHLKNTAQLFLNSREFKRGDYDIYSLGGLPQEIQQHTINFLDEKALSALYCSAALFKPLVNKERLVRTKELREILPSAINNLSDFINKEILQMIFDSIFAGNKNKVLELSVKYPKLFFFPVFVTDKFITPLTLIKQLKHPGWLNELLKIHTPTSDEVKFDHTQYPNYLDWMIACGADIDKYFGSSSFEEFIEESVNTRKCIGINIKFEFSYTEQSIIYNNNIFFAKLISLIENNKSSNTKFLEMDLIGLLFPSLTLATFVNNQRFINDYFMTFSKTIKNTLKNCIESLIRDINFLRGDIYAKLPSQINLSYLHFMVLLNRTDLCLKYLSSKETFRVDEGLPCFYFPKLFKDFLFSLNSTRMLNAIFPAKQTGWTALMLAALMGHHELINKIFEKCLFNLEHELDRNDGFNVLCCALLSGNTKTLLAVIDGLKQFDLFEQAQKIEINDVIYIKTNTTELADFIVHNESVEQTMKDTAQLYLDMINAEYHLTI